MYEFNKYQKRWFTALRSRKYKQGKSNLCALDSAGTLRYCCLGVASEEFKDELGIVKLKAPENTYTYYDGHTTFPPESLVEALRLRDNGGGFRYSVQSEHGNEVDSLVAANDVYGWTFEQIADFAEQNPESVFEP